MAATTIDILQAIKGDTTTISAAVESIASAKSPDGMNLSTLLNGDVSGRSKKIDNMKKSTEIMAGAIGILKSMKDIDVKSVMKFHALPFDMIAKKIKSFYDDMSEISKSPSVKSAGLLVKATVDMINMLMTVDPVKMRAKIIMFPTSAVTNFMTKFFIGRGNIEKPGGLLGALLKIKFVVNRHFNKAASEAFKSNILNVKTVLLSLGSMVVTTTLLGLIAIPALPLIALGFGAIFATLGFTVLMSKAVKKAKISVTETDMVGIFQMSAYIALASLIVLTSAAVGKKVSEPKMWYLVPLGFVIISATAFAIAGVSKLLAKVMKIGKIMTSFGQILILNMYMLTAAGLVLTAYGVSKVIATPEAMGMTALGIVAILGVIAGLGFISNFMSTSAKAAWKGLLAFVPLMLICALSAGMLLAVNSIADKFEWKNIGKALAGIGAVILAFAGVAALAALAVTYAWIGVLGFIPIALIAFGTIKLTEMTAELKDKIEAAGGVDSLSTYVEGIGTIITKLVTSVGDISLIKIAKATAALPAVLGLMKATSMLADIISKFETDGDKMKIVHFDNDGNVTFSKEVNVVKIATALGIAMRNFSVAVLDGLSKAQTPEDGKKKVKLITALMEPVSKFADVVSKFSTGKDGVIKTIDLDENGKVISEREVDIKQVGNTIALGITEFINTIGPAIEGINNMPSISSANMFKDDPAEKLKDALKAVTDFNATVSEIDVNQSKADQFQKMNLTFIKTMEDTFNMYGEGFLKQSTQKNLASFVKKHVDYIDNMTKALNKNKTPFREYVDTLKEFTKEIEKVKPFLDKEEGLVLKVDKSTNNNTTNNYKMDSKDFEKVAEAFKEPVKEGVMEACEGLEISQRNVAKNASNKLEGIVFDVNVAK